jgi:hypothetical protein
MITHGFSASRVFCFRRALIDSKPVSTACSPPARNRQADVAPWWALSRRQNFAIYAAVSHGALGKKAVVHVFACLAIVCGADTPSAPFTFLECYLFAICRSDTCSAEPPRMTRAASCRTKRRGGDAMRCMQASRRAERRTQKTGIAATPEAATAIPKHHHHRPAQTSVSVDKQLPKTHYRDVAPRPRPTAIHRDPPLCVAGARTRAYRNRRGRVVVATCAFLRPVPGSDVPCEHHRYQHSAPSLSARVCATPPKRVCLWQTSRHGR